MSHSHHLLESDPSTPVTRVSGLSGGQQSHILEVFQYLQKAAYDNACNKGFHDEPRTFGDDCALLHTEVSEAFEAYRTDGYTTSYREGDDKPEGVASELVDILIRLFDTAQYRGIDLGFMLLEKMAFNETRSKMHGGKLL